MFRPALQESSFDPATQPVVACTPLPPLTASGLRLEHIRKAFLEPVPWQVEPLFSAAFSPGPGARSRARPAAVLVPLVAHDDGLRMLLTRRADHLHHHAGQVSFPGGCIEAVDPNPVAAALRETAEEIGVDGRYVQVMGMQPSLLTTSRFLMTPVVGELLPGFQIRPDTSEVAEVFEVPLEVLMDPTRHVLHRYQPRAGRDRYYFSIRWESHFIWGATATLIRNFYRFLSASQSA